MSMINNIIPVSIALLRSSYTALMQGGFDQMEKKVISNLKQKEF